MLGTVGSSSVEALSGRLLVIVMDVRSILQQSRFEYRKSATFSFMMASKEISLEHRS